jgi:outer membrane protein OmpA-like peptidoglycan-associated protein
MVERTDLSRYLNGKYTGLTRREVRSFIDMHPSAENTPQKYSGTFYVLEETIRNSRASAQGVSGMIPASFTLSPNGTMMMSEDNGYPPFRGFPAYPASEVRTGDTWQASAVRCVDPLNKGVPTRMKIFVAYEYVGEGDWNERPIYHIRAKWATRYRERDSRGDPDLKDASGSHSADIYADRETGAALLVRDTVDETFSYIDGTTVRFRGSILLFTEFPPMIDKGVVVTAFGRAAGAVPDGAVTSSVQAEVDSPGSSFGDSAGRIIAAGTGNSSGLLIEEVPEGLRLSIRNIRFEADSDRILPGERWRLDAIAEVLRSADGAAFLVEGHTAATGKPDGEKELSVQRARRIADELILRGIPADRFLYAGYGGDRPVAPNDTDEGRAQNRRVEITILQ